MKTYACTAVLALAVSGCAPTPERTDPPYIVVAYSGYHSMARYQVFADDEMWRRRYFGIYTERGIENERFDLPAGSYEVLRAAVTDRVDALAGQEEPPCAELETVFFGGFVAAIVDGPQVEGAAPPSAYEVADISADCVDTPHWLAAEELFALIEQWVAP